MENLHPHATQHGRLGANPKYPHALGEPATSINRWYLKLKSELIPYAYSIAEEAVDGMPMIRPGS